jgi:competence protein ComEA
MHRIPFVFGLLLVVLLSIGGRAEAQERPRAPQSNGAAATTPLNLNTATAAQLETLPGIGAATAQRIVEYREKNGPFKKVEELMNVRGVGEKTFLKLKPLITVTAPGGGQ